jgi:protein-S-isoprenylcysteine O-methyltransferase Ste14
VRWRHAKNPTAPRSGAHRYVGRWQGGEKVQELTAQGQLVVTAIVLRLGGAATGLELLCGGWLWLGSVVVGSGLLILLALDLFMGLRTWQHRVRQYQGHQYDERQRQQRAACGPGVADRATEDGPLQHHR